MALLTWHDESASNRGRPNLVQVIACDTCAGSAELASELSITGAESLIGPAAMVVRYPIFLRIWEYIGPNRDINLCAFCLWNMFGFFVFF